MKLLIRNIPAFVFLYTGVFLLLRDHIIAGGFLVVCAVFAGRAE
jgi:hypothetical protein